MAEPVRILVLEDEYFIADEVASTIAACAAQPVGPFSSEELAIEVNPGSPFDAAILDIRLNGLDCFKVARMLRANDRPFVFLSAHNPAVIPDEFTGIPLVSKPHDMYHLRKVCRWLISEVISRRLRSAL